MIAVTGSEAAVAKLQALGHEAAFFADGLEMERMIRAGSVTAVLDLAPVEVLTNNDRLTAAAIAGIPQVISLGGLDVEPSPEKLDDMGKRIAEIASASQGPTRVLVPLQGISAAAPSEAVLAMFQSLRNWIYPPKLLDECEMRIDDDLFLNVCIVFILKSRERQ